MKLKKMIMHHKEQNNNRMHSRERNGSPAAVAAGDSIQLRCEPRSVVTEVERVFWMQCEGRKHGRKQSSSAAVEWKIGKTNDE